MMVLHLYGKSLFAHFLAFKLLCDRLALLESGLVNLAERNNDLNCGLVAA